MPTCSRCGTSTTLDHDSGDADSGDLGSGDLGGGDPSSGELGSGYLGSAHRDDVPLSWVTSRENGRLRLFCPDCARAHLRSIEAKLDSAWW